MERSLDRSLLSAALGDGRGWPTPTELADAIASAELRLLFGDTAEADLALEETGWLLLAIASSSGAVERYGVARQRAAFAVAGHILDLAIRVHGPQSPGLAWYTFGAQVCALGSGADPNAVALSRRSGQPPTERYDLVTDVGRVSLHLGTALLGMDTEFLDRHLPGLQAQAANLRFRWELDSIDHTLFAATAHCVQGIQHCYRFLSDGGDLGAACRCFDDALGAIGAVSDHASRWVAWHLRRLADQFGASSIWTALPPSVPDWARRALTHVPPRVMTLWPPQLEFLAPDDSGAPGLLDSSARRIVVTMPTSAGKTALAQIAIATHLVTEQTGVCYVAPSRGLCAEIRGDLAQRLRPLNKSVAPERPDWGVGFEGTDTRHNVEVMTPERLAALLRTNADEVVARFGMFVFDEAHHVGDRQRGWILESAISYLHFRLLDMPSRIVLISAVIGNRSHFAQWLSADGAAAVERHSDWRGPRRLTCFYKTKAEWEEATELRPGRDGLRRRRVPLYGVLQPTATPGTWRQTTEPIGELQQRATTATPGRTDWKRQNESTPLYKVNAFMASTLATLAPPLLVVAAKRDEADRLASEVVQVLPQFDSPHIQGLLALVQRRLGDGHPLATYLRAGVAVHTAALPDDVREAIEGAVRQGIVRCVVATTTITDGVNLGVSSVFVASREIQRGNDREQVVDRAKLLNAFGRAGRAMRETEGIAVLAHHSNTQVPESEIDATSNEVRSSLATDAALGAFEQLEDNIRQSQDAVFEADGAPGEFASFCWFAAAELDRLEDHRPTALVDLAKQTLALQQMDSDQQSRWLSFAATVREVYNLTEEAPRRRWARSGLPLRRARLLDAVADACLVQTERLEQAPDAAEQVAILLCTEELERQAMGGCKVVLRSGLGDLVADWMRGCELRHLANTHIQARKGHCAAEDLAEVTAQVLSYHLPWLLSAVVSALNDASIANEQPPVLSPGLPAWVRWGHNDPLAVQLRAGGVPTRETANRTVDAWCREHGAEPLDGSARDVREWLCHAAVSSWVRRLGLVLDDVAPLLAFVRAPAESFTHRYWQTGATTIPVLSGLCDPGLDGKSAQLGMPSGTDHDVVVTVDDRVVAVVAPDAHSDVRDLVRAGAPMACTYRCEPRGAWLHIGQ